MRRAGAFLVATAALLLVSGASGAAPASLEPIGGAVFPKRSFVLTLPAPRALSASLVRVTENGVPVSGLGIAHEGASQQTQSAVVLAIDASGSMAGKPIAAALAAAREFVARRTQKEQIAVVTFNGAVSVVQSFTTDPLAVIASLEKTPRIGVGTKLYDALGLGLHLIAADHPAIASIVVLSDGRDVGSVTKSASILGGLAAAHVRVFSVGIPSPTYDAKALGEMASTTGGSYVEATTLSQLTPTLDALAARLSSEYIVTYSSHQNPRTRVTVSVALQGVPGAASSVYVTPEVRFSPTAVYAPSTTARIVESRTTVAFVVLAFVALLSFAVVNAARHRSDLLVRRVGGFVSLPGDRPTASAGVTQNPAAARGFLARAQKSVGKRAWSERLTTSLELAGIDMTPVKVVLLTAGAMVTSALILNLILGPLGALGALVVVPYGVRRLIRGRIRRMRQAFADQLPDNLEVLASALRAGHSLVGALTVVADDAAEPSKGEYRRVIAEERLGVPLEDALNVAVTRTHSQDLEQVALIARLSREMGSNSAEVLDRVVENVRGKMELRRLVKTLTTQGRMSRWVLSALPAGFVLIISVIDPGYMHPLFHELAGQIILVIATILVVLGSVVIGKIVDIKI